jgi:Cdc6-like AAA superfamily ATPase
MNKFETNPFERSALTNSELLAARTNELRQIRFILRNASKQKYRFKHLLITGNRGVGKTSFLNIINDESPTYNLVPIKINLTHSNSSNSNEFFWNLFMQTIRKLFKYNLLDGEKGAVDIAIQKLLNSTLTD